jgi:hypothetical protein
MDPEIDPPSFLEDEMDNPYKEENYSHNLVKNLENKSQKKTGSSENLNFNLDHKNKVLITNQNLNLNKEKNQKNLNSKNIPSASSKKIEIISKDKSSQPISSRPQTLKKESTKTPLNLIDNFEKKLNKAQNFEYNFDKQNDSDYEEEINTPIDDLTDRKEILKKYNHIQEKLKEKQQQVQDLQRSLQDIKKSNTEFMEVISKDTPGEIKDRKLIELAKKNTDLKIKIEKYKLREKELENKLRNLVESREKENRENQSTNIINDKINNLISGQINNNLNNVTSTLDEERKKLKAAETKIVEMRNKLQSCKEENTKLNILIKREIGEAIDIDKALKDKAYWKGRSEIIESLKTKIKILEAQRETLGNLGNMSQLQGNNSDSQGNPNVSVISSTARNNSIPNTNMISYSEYKKEKEKLNSEIEKLKEENAKFSQENSRFKTRNNVLEKELRSQKEDLHSKIKILIEKSDNDEKLILALNKELEKRGSRPIAPSQLGYENPVFNLQQEINKLRIELKEKDDYINNLNSIMMPESKSDNQKSQWNNNSLGKIITKLKELEEENKKLKLDSDDGKIYEALARENAKLRLRVKDLEDKLSDLS